MMTMVRMRMMLVVWSFNVSKPLRWQENDGAIATFDNIILIKRKAIGGQ